MAELVDALVSNTSGETRAGSTPALGTRHVKVLQGFLAALCCFLNKTLPSLLMLVALTTFAVFGGREDINE